MHFLLPSILIHPQLPSSSLFLGSNSPRSPTTSNPYPLFLQSHSFSTCPILILASLPPLAPSLLISCIFLPAHHRFCFNVTRISCFGVFVVLVPEISLGNSCPDPLQFSLVPSEMSHGQRNQNAGFSMSGICF